MKIFIACLMLNMKMAQPYSIALPETSGISVLGHQRRICVGMWSKLNFIHEAAVVELMLKRTKGSSADLPSAFARILVGSLISFGCWSEACVPVSAEHVEDVEDSPDVA